MTTAVLSPASLIDVDRWFRACVYLGAAQLYLRDNALLREPLRPEHIKPRLLGHWGTQPGLALVSAQVNRLIRNRGSKIVLVVGPGHGAPAILASTFLDGSLGEGDDRFMRDGDGVAHLVHDFSWPRGLASHLTPRVPGMMHEGGELGYSLAHAFGAVFDVPDRVAVCIVGDGEAESGPLAAAWQSPKFLHPAESGAVLPVLHLNGYKLGGPTLYGRMSDDDLRSHFGGLGWRVTLVTVEDESSVHERLAYAFDAAMDEIAGLQQRARAGDDTLPVWPLIVMRSRKGWTGPGRVENVQIEGTEHAHQIPLEHPVDDPIQLAALEAWLRSYNPAELFDASGAPAPETIALAPQAGTRIADEYLRTFPARALTLPALEAHAVQVRIPGAIQSETMRALGAWMRDAVAPNAENANLRFFCPDEFASNRMDAVYAATPRAWMLPRIATDTNLAPHGRVIEILSETCCEGWLEGYVLTGRHGLFVSYEAFVRIAVTMANLHGKWLKMAHDVAWRPNVPSLNYVLSSHVWRQDQDGYSHQGPGFINALLDAKRTTVRIYHACDANVLLACAERALESRNKINVIIAGKHPAPQWLTIDQAREQLACGALRWAWASDAGTPDVVLAAAGDVPTIEALAATMLLREHVPGIRVAVVNVVDLLVLDGGAPGALGDGAFAALFPAGVPVIVAYHGYASVVHELLHGRIDADRFHVHGYQEEGTTTTPFDMTVLNEMSRFHLAIDAIRRLGREDTAATALVRFCKDRLEAHVEYIWENGIDLPEVRDWIWC
jgi:xylulose-5-phosphate/fructose-6-phosphate phosphoketolase